MIYDSYDSLKDNILKLEDTINFGIEGCTRYKVCENFLENLTQKSPVDTFSNDYIFKVLKADKSKLSKMYYEKVVSVYKDLPYFPECEENEKTTFISLTNITLALFQIKENSYKSIWDD